MIELNLRLITIEQKLIRLERAVYPESVPLSEWRGREGDFPGGKGLKRRDLKRMRLPFACDVRFRKAYFTHDFKVPRQWRGQNVVVGVDLEEEAIGFMDSAVRCGVDAAHPDVPLHRSEKDGRRHTLGLEVWACRMTRTGDVILRLNSASLRTVDEEVAEGAAFFRAAQGLIEPGPEPLPDAELMLRALEEALQGLDLDAGRDALRRSLAAAVRHYRKTVEPVASRVPIAEFSLIGHAHLDSAWRWPVAVTRRKNIRTVASVLGLMRRFPGFHYLQSQPVQYEWIREDVPHFYKEIKKRVREGRWEPTGGMWIEPDCNIPWGESLVRQCLFGQRFFRKEFGRDSKVAWLPDVFGFTWALPQIFKKSGIDFFYTTKMRWNDTNQIPHAVLDWQGVDGTRIHSVLSRFGYNGLVTSRDLRERWEGFPDKEHHNRLLLPFGKGNGGGGPREPDLRCARQLAKVTKTMTVKHDSAERYFRSLFRGAKNPPLWKDELYFELHRGTLTSQARTKRLNRKCESALRRAEMLCAFAMRHGKKYPSARLEKSWKTLLFNQFHDILPGSSVRAVYVQTERELNEVQSTADELAAAALRRIARDIDTRGPGQPLLIFNPLSWRRRDVVSIEERNVIVLDENGREVPCQLSAGSKPELRFAIDLPPTGYAVYRLMKGRPARARGGAFSGTMENEHLRVRLNGDGEVTSAVLKSTGRETLPRGTVGNRIRTFRDLPRNWEAWDVDSDYRSLELDLFKTRSVRLVESGPLATVVEIVKKSRRSMLRQRITLYAESPYVLFDTEVDWRDRRTLMEVSFPVDVNTRRATYEIPFGTIERSNHEDTSWDAAKFQVPAQRWADLAEAGFGAALLNDCKYAYRALGQELSMTLLRAPNAPDPEADLGQQVFTYAFMPHAGDWREAGVARRAAEINHPVLTLRAGRHAGKFPSAFSFVSVDQGNVVLDTVKKAEDSNDLVLRLYEAHGARGPARMKINVPAKRAAACNLLEEAEKKVKLSKGAVRFTIKPYEIKTFKVR